MTSLDKIDRASTTPPASSVVPGRHLAIELAETLRLAVPIALTQLGQIAMMTTDIALIGRLGDEAGAAAGAGPPPVFLPLSLRNGVGSSPSPPAPPTCRGPAPRPGRRAAPPSAW